MLFVAKIQIKTINSKIILNKEVTQPSSNSPKKIKYISALDIISIDDDVGEVIVVISNATKWKARTEN